MELCDSPFFRILRAGLWNAQLSESEIDRLEEQELDMVAQLARMHAVCALIADGAPVMSCRLEEDVARTENGNRLVNRVAETMAVVWKAQGIKAVLLKGQGLAAIYPNPLHRTPGDIDWYFPGQDNFARALECAVGRGATPVMDGDSDYHYIAGGVVVEHHRRWLDISNPFKRRKAALLEAGHGTESSGTYELLPPLLDLVQLNVHILKHLLVSGIGWRQMCDLALAYSRFSGSYSAVEYEAAVKSLGIFRWTKLLNGVLVRYLGLDAEILPFPPATGKDVDRLGLMVTECGNFRSAMGGGMLRAYLHKFGLLAGYAPLELFWRPARLAWTRFAALFVKN